MQDGVMLLVDMMSAGRVNGTTIDFKTGPMGSGFEIFRAKVKSMTVQELKEKRSRDVNTDGVFANYLANIARVVEAVDRHIHPQR